MANLGLGLYSDRAFEIMSGISKMANFCYYDGFSKCRVVRGEDNEVVLDKDGSGYRMVTTLDGPKLGLILKKYLYERNRDFARKPGGYSKNSTDPLKFRDLVCEAREFFCIFDVLCGHSIELLKRTYGAEFVDKLVGQPLNPFLIEQRRLMEAEKKRIKDEYSKLENDNYVSFEKRIDELRKERSAEYNRLETEKREKLEEVGRMFAAVG